VRKPRWPPPFPGGIRRGPGRTFSPRKNALELAQAQNRVTEARAALERARAERATETRADEVRSAEAAVRQARAQVISARSSTRQNLMRLDDVAQARAQVTQLENSMREIAVRQNDTRLLAPMSGVVTRRYVEEGELITSGVSAFSSGQAVLQIADLSRCASP
jgi:multidrug resistance efflux pump